jgi:hypothetical protein
MPWRNASDLVLHHGTVDLHVPSITNGIDVTIGGLDKDFSRGFYTTTNFNQAARRARQLLHRFQWAGARHAVVATFVVNRDAISKLSSMAFVYPTDDFWDLIAWCRSRRASHHAGGYYDVVYGPVSASYEDRLIIEEYDQVSFHNATNVSVLGAPQWRGV